MPNYWWFLASVALLAIGASIGAAQDRPRLSLDGMWEFRFAPDDLGTSQHWFEPGASFPMKIHVPGCWDAQGVGERTDRMNHNAVGVGWYRTTRVLPPALEGRRIWLVVGGAHRRAVVWINGHQAAQHIGYPVFFRADITPYLVPRSTQTIVIAVDSRPDVTLDPLMGTFDLPDFMEVNWGGLFESVHLEATDDVWLQDVFVEPDPHSKQARVTVEWQNEGPSNEPLTLDYGVRLWQGRPSSPPLTSGSIVLDRNVAFPAVLNLSMPRAPLWTPDTPHLLVLDLTLRSKEQLLDRRTVRFGLRRVEIRGNDFYLNGEKFFLRGYGDDWNFPIEVSGLSDVNAWIRYLYLRKSFGFNGVRHHSCMPPESYLEAADLVGMLVQPELPIAYMSFYEAAERAGSLDVFRRVWEGYIRQMRNHPSVFAWCAGNELPALPLTQELYETAKRLDPTRPVIDTDGLFTPTDRPTLDYFTMQFSEGTLPWGDTKAKYRLPKTLSRPVIVHEMSNLCVLPDPADIAHYTGGVRAFWLEALAAQIESQKLEFWFPQMLAASRRLQASLLKLNIEAARLSPDVRGYHQWLFRDYWAQSSGFVNQFDEAPRALMPDQTQQFNGDAVLLWDRDRAAYRAGETLSLRLFLSDYRPANAPRLDPVRVTLGKTVVTLQPPADVGGRGLLGPWTGDIRFPVSRKPVKLTLNAEVGPMKNDWQVWVFPTVSPPTATKTKIVGSLTRQMLDQLEQGAAVLLTDPAPLFPTLTASFKPAWWHGDEADHVFGNLLMVHPALAGFPADGYGDLQMAGMMDGRPVVLLDEVPGHIEPIVWCLDLPWKMRRKAYLFEAQVGKGRLLVSSFDLSSDRREQDPAAAWLYAQLARYVNGAKFQPSSDLPVEWLQERGGR